MAVVINGSAGVTTNSGAVYNGISAGTAVASTSGTSIDFTSIPSWVKRITVMFSGVSTNGTGDWLVKIGSGGSVTSSGYTSTAALMPTTPSTASSTAGFIIRSNSASANICGAMVITLVSGTTWIESWAGGASSGSQCFIGGGNVTLSGALDILRITTVNGTDTFDAGSINILYE